MEQSKAGDFSIMLDGKQYTERPAAGDAFALLYRTINENHAKDDFEFEIGSYRGFRLCLNLHPLSRGIILRGTSRYSTDIGSSGQGTITRIENLAERIPFYLVNTQRDLEEAEKQLEAARQQMGQPFIYEEELSEKVAALTEINTKLEFESLQEQESEVILDEDGERSDCKKAQSADCVLPSAGTEL